MLPDAAINSTRSIDRADVVEGICATKYTRDLKAVAPSDGRSSNCCARLVDKGLHAPIYYKLSLFRTLSNRSLSAAITSHDNSGQIRQYRPSSSVKITPNAFCMMIARGRTPFQPQAVAISSKMRIGISYNNSGARPLDYAIAIKKMPPQVTATQKAKIVASQQLRPSRGPCDDWPASVFVRCTPKTHCAWQ
jgi:hypothetical protein